MYDSNNAFVGSWDHNEIKEFTPDLPEAEDMYQNFRLFFCRSRKSNTNHTGGPVAMSEWRLKTEVVV